MPRNGNGNGDGQQPSKPRRKVEDWETLEVLYSGRESAKKADIGLVIEVKQPVFEGGSRGFPKLGMTLSRGERFLRFVCFDGDLSELEALQTLITGAEAAGFEGFQAAYDGHVATYKSANPRNDKGSWGGGPRKLGGVGGGLGRFSSEGKTDRKRRKRRREKDEQRA